MPADRLKKYKKMFVGYKVAQCQSNSKKISFKLADHRICESTMLLMIGLISPSQTASQAPSQWRRLKKGFLQSQMQAFDGPLVIETLDECLEAQSMKTPVQGRFKSKQGLYCLSIFIVSLY